MMETVQELRQSKNLERRTKRNGHGRDKGNTSENEVKEAKEEK